MLTTIITDESDFSLTLVPVYIISIVPINTVPSVSSIQVKPFLSEANINSIRMKIVNP